MPLPITRKEIIIKAGEYFASPDPVIIKTLLGSCVAACLYDPTTRIGGMNHILLPGRADLGCYNACARFGINAMELLINRIMNLGGRRSSLTAKVFGGAHLLSSIPEENSVGQLIADFTLEFCRLERIKILRHDIGGHAYRKVRFHTDTGKAFVKRGQPAKQAVINQEREYMQKLRQHIEKPGGITLFGKWRTKGRPFGR